MKNIYLPVKELLPSLIKEEDKDLSEKLQSNLNTEEKYPSIPLDDQVRQKTEKLSKIFFCFI
jgi:hypothetical protein